MLNACLQLLFKVNAGQTYAQRINAEYLDYAEVVDVAFDSDTRVRKYGKIARYVTHQNKKKICKLQ